MRIGIILHGPEIVDTGSAKRIIDMFKRKHDVTAKLGGTMGRTAVLDAGLEDIIGISKGLTPSETILSIKDAIDLAVLLNHGKTLDTGRSFGQIVASKISQIPLVHIERPDCGGRIIYYTQEAKRCAEYVRHMLRETYDLPIESGCPAPSHIRTDGDLVIRRISGAFVGENIRLDGIVVGEITHHEPEIVCRDGRIVELRGIKAKPHGLEKLKNRRTDLFTARVKTGNIRRSLHEPRIRKMLCRTPCSRIAIIDHCAESTFELVKDAGLVITVGDDTTAIAADILARLGIPVIGIVDGDMDGVLGNAVVPMGSVVIRVKPGFDDIVGREVFEILMGGEQEISMEWSELLARILALAEKYVVDVGYY
ncbi:MAG: DUF2117 domain-containing protein [Candidatus Methanoperedens sp.]|nr:DUF2117 domain-containing protein [Candidatus Methanoperedens sp.]MCZ7394763.1 DUF2117 domain-containing protein [Candidatus Methanoperedens sp.]